MTDAAQLTIIEMWAKTYIKHAPRSRGRCCDGDHRPKEGNRVSKRDDWREQITCAYSSP